MVGAIGNLSIAIFAEDMEVRFPLNEFEVYEIDVEKHPEARFDIIEEVMLFGWPTEKCYRDELPSTL